MKHTTFHRDFVWDALVAALAAGFPLGAHVGIPESAVVARTAFAVSGLLGLVAVWWLAVNMWKTASQG
jgi:hypothetical protein